MHILNSVDATYCYYCCSVVCLFVSVCPTQFVRPTKMAELIDMRFGLWTRVGLRNHVLDRLRVRIPHGKRQFGGGEEGDP